MFAEIGRWRFQYASLSMAEGQLGAVSNFNNSDFYITHRLFVSLCILSLGDFDIYSCYDIPYPMFKFFLCPIQTKNLYVSSIPQTIRSAVTFLE